MRQIPSLKYINDVSILYRIVLDLRPLSPLCLIKMHMKLIAYTEHTTSSHGVNGATVPYICLSIRT